MKNRLNIFDDNPAFKSSLKPGYRYRQVMEWVFSKGIYDFEQMSNIGKEQRRELSDQYSIMTIFEKKREESADGSTAKILFGTEDGLSFETVVMPYENRKTVCVSTQIGCRMGCGFCATGAQGFTRDLSISEIMGQILFFPDITNIVFMGMGEPLDNLDNLQKVLFFINDPQHMDFGARRVTISTVGIPHGIKTLAETERQFGLSLSLHSTMDGVRDRIIPVNRRYPIAEVLKAVKEYRSITKGAVTFEFILIKGLNMNREEAERLMDFSRDTGAKINFIPYNEHSFSTYKRPDEGEIRRFLSLFDRPGIFYTVRDSRGQDISAACGQLAGESKG